MKTNLIIGSEDLASRILLSRLPAAQLIPGNGAKMYLVGCHLSDYRGYYHISRLWVWAVRTGKNSFAGLIFNSGIIPDGGNEITGGVFVTFVEDDILTEEDEDLNKREIHPGVTLRIDDEGRQSLEYIRYPDNLSAEAALKALYPGLKLKGGVIMIKIGIPKQMKTYWVIADGQKIIGAFRPLTAKRLPSRTVFRFTRLNSGNMPGKAIICASVTKIYSDQKKGCLTAAFLVFSDFHIPFFMQENKNSDRNAQGVQRRHDAQRHPGLADDKAGKQSHNQHHRNKHKGRHFHLFGRNGRNAADHQKGDNQHQNAAESV